MKPNFVSEFEYNDEVEILDELGGSTGKRGYVHAIYCKQDNDTPEYAVMLAAPFSGARHYPAALLRKVDKPATQRVQHVIQRKRKRRTRQADEAPAEVIVLTGPPLPKQNASAATPRRRALQVRPHPQSGDAAIEHSTDRATASSRGGAK